MVVCPPACTQPAGFLAECEKSVDSKIYEIPGKESL